MKKYLEYFDGAFDSTVADKMKPENKPYVAYSKTEGVVFTVIPEEPTSAYEMVDLGLSVKWANMNVGAETPQDNGLYFSWGNVDGHAVDENGNVVDYSFDETTYASTLGGQYTGSTLDAEHDAATVNMGDGWRMPTIADTMELVNNTTQTVDTENGGMIFTSKTNGASIFIPFAGDSAWNGAGAFGTMGFVWSSSTNGSSAAYVLGCNKGGIADSDAGKSKHVGMSVRGVHA